MGGSDRDSSEGKAKWIYFASFYLGTEPRNLEETTLNTAEPAGRQDGLDEEMRDSL